MKIYKEEYNKMVEQFNYKHSGFLMELILFVVLVIVTVINCLFSENLFDIIMSIVVGVVIYLFSIYLFRKKIKESINNLKIEYVEQEIFEDRINQTIFKSSQKELVGNFYYCDIIKVREDKNNFYLYINRNNAIVMSKRKMENSESFKQLLLEKCNIQKEKR